MAAPQTSATVHAAPGRPGDVAALLTTICATVPEVIAAKDRDGRYVYANPLCCAVFGREPEAVLGRTDAEIHAPAVAAVLRAADVAVMTGGTSLTCTEVVPDARFEGATRTWTSVKTPWRDASGAIVGVIVTSRDETEAHALRAERERLLEAERDARLKAERLQLLTDTLSRCATPADVVHAAIREAGRAVGSTAGALGLLTPDGERFRVVDSPLLSPDLVREWQAEPVSGPIPGAVAIRTGEPCYSRTRAEYVARDRRLAAVAARHGIEAHAALPLLVPDGEGHDRTIGVITFQFGQPRPFDADDDRYLRTVAELCAQALERTRLAAAAVAAREEAERANAVKGTFLAHMSHELRTPLNAIAGHVHLLARAVHGPVTPAQHDALQRIQRAQRHLLGLINDVLNFARLEAGEVQWRIAPVVLADAARGAAALMEPLALERGLVLAVHVDPHAAPRALADAEKLDQVLLNLVSNAIKFTPGQRADGGPGMVTMAIVADGGGHVTIEVRDTGIGIPADRLESIFEPFVQVRDDARPPEGGTGLGLSISRDLVRGMGGELSASSCIGAGSCFRIRLRAAP